MDKVAVGRDAITIRHLYAGYDHQMILQDVSLTVKPLDFIGIVGPNGGGKTTLFKVVLGLIPAVSGEVLIMGKSVAEGRRHIGYVPQLMAFDRDFPISVWEVVQMGRLGSRGLLRRYTGEDNRIVEDALSRVDMLEHADLPIGDLSGGQQQRAYIARALATEPDILLLDEPLVSVDPQVSASIYELLHELNVETTILIASHDIGAISSHVHTVACLNRKLFYHGEDQLTQEMLELAYQCPIDLIAHGVPHRVFREHTPGGSET
ncbi:MAG: metal ABC transporter ATP-binding protein [Anaerolineae bacterium]|jgi:zinc transport system ATP-binding protein